MYDVCIINKNEIDNHVDYTLSYLGFEYNGCTKPLNLEFISQYSRYPRSSEF